VMHEACERDEFRTPCSPPDLKIVQVTSDDARSSEAIYLDAPSWTPDSKRFLFRRSASEDGSRRAGTWLCDTDDNFSIRPISDSRDVFLAPDGTAAYRVERVADKLEVRRVDLDTGAETPVADAPAPYSLRGCTTISADSRRLCTGAFLGDGTTEGAPWGACIFDLHRGTHRVIEFGNGYRNMHCQYSHNPDPTYSHDIAVMGTDGKLSDGSWLTPPDGSWRWENMPPPFPPGQGCRGVHQVVRDDGTNWRVVPLGNGVDVVSGGHITWRGMEYSLVASMYHHPPGRWRAPLFEAQPIPIRELRDRWLGQTMPGAHVVDLTRKLARADSCHFGFDLSGRHFVSDTDGYNVGEYSFVYVGTYFDPPDEEPYVKTAYLLLPRTSWKGQPAHPHPYLSPDGKYVVFQSDFTGRPQVHVAYDFDYPA